MRFADSLGETPVTLATASLDTLDSDWLQDSCVSIKNNYAIQQRVEIRILTCTHNLLLTLDQPETQNCLNSLVCMDVRCKRYYYVVHTVMSVCWCS